jgi:hypothetical protein
MEQQPLLNTHMAPPLRSSSEQLLAQRTKKRAQSNCSSCKTSCKKVVPLWGIALPLALASIPVSVYGVVKEIPTLRYVGYGMDIGAILIAAGWFAANYRQLERERLEILERIKSERLSQQLTRLNAFDESLE